MIFPWKLPSIKIPRQVWAYAGVLVVAIFTGLFIYNSGRNAEEKKWLAKVERGKELVEKLRANQGKITIKTEVRYVDRVKVIKEKARVIEKKILVYIPVDTPDLPGGFRVLHDSAALGTVPGAAEDGLPVSVRTATSTINRNYAICHQWKAALDAQRQWAQEQRAVYLSECKRLGQKCS